MKIYRIKDWSSRYENNRTRELKAMAWVPVPNSHDGDGYTELVDRENGAALLGAWLVILQVASKCDPRGTLLRDGGNPHDSSTIARMTRIPKEIIEKAISVLVNDVKWLEIIEDSSIPQADAAIPHDGAAMSHPSDEEQNRTEQKENAKAVILFLNEKTGRAFRATPSNLEIIISRLKEPGVTFDGVKKMIERQCKRWKGDSTMEEYLRPETLFRKSKFDSYYAAKDVPISALQQSSIYPSSKGSNL